VTKIRSERRRHTRHVIACPVSLLDGQKLIAREKCVNISNGGLLVPLPNGEADAAGDSLSVGWELDVEIAIPRWTANTYMLEHFATTAKVARLQPSTAGSPPALAVQFDKPVLFNLDV
jgi:hypothetical protein